jgi:hypothetical protein
VLLFGGGITALMVALHGVVNGWWQRRPGAAPALLAILVLAITTLASLNPNGPGLEFLAMAVVGAVCLGWLGYNLERMRPGGLPAGALAATQVVPASTARAVQPGDVVGPWRFYVDDAVSTVTVDLQSSGRYTQVIVGNRGDPVECPGGTWKLDGSYLELTSYRSALRAMTDRVRWFFGECRKELVLFAKDDPQGQTILQGRRAVP